MLGGYPLPAAVGFFDQAVQIVRDHGGYNVDLDTVIMTKYSACRAQHHLFEKVLTSHPDIVVLQFGSTDAGAPLRRGIGVRWIASKTGIFKPVRVSNHSPEFKHLVKWWLWGLASDVLQVKPRSSLNDFLAANENMVEQCLTAGSAIVVLSPLVMGFSRSNRFARIYSEALGERLAGRPGCYFVNAHAVLSRVSNRHVMLFDGFHLSACGHKLLSKALGDVLLDAVSRLPRPSQTVSA